MAEKTPRDDVQFQTPCPPQMVFCCRFHVLKHEFHGIGIHADIDNRPNVCNHVWLESVGLLNGFSWLVLSHNMVRTQIFTNQRMGISSIFSCAIMMDDHKILRGPSEPSTPKLFWAKLYGLFLGPRNHLLDTVRSKPLQ